VSEVSATSKAKWFNVDTDDRAGLAQAIVGRVTGIENWVMGARYQNALYARLATGRELPIMFGSWMQKRVGPTTTSFAKAPFELPTDNIVAGGIDTLYNRLGTHPWVTVVPNGDFNCRTQAKVQESWFAKDFERARFYSEIYDPCRIDNMVWGNAFCLVDTLRENVRYRRILRDEVLVDEIEAAKGKPTSIILSLTGDRDELMDEYADDEDALEAIERAPGAFPGVYYPGSNLADMIQVYICYKLPNADGKHGRHTVCTRDGVLEDWAWTRPHFPIAKMTCLPQSLGYWGMGIPEAGWDYQLELNRLWATATEAQRHGAIGTILARNDSHITTKQLSSSLQQRIIRYDTTAPEFIAPRSVSNEIYESMDRVTRAFAKRVGISPEQQGGETDPGITSGRARIVKEQIHDLRNVSIGKNQEQFVTDCANLAYEAAEEAGLEIETPEGRIDWSLGSMAPDGMRRVAFPVSSLPSEPAGRQQQIDTWYANGFVSRAEKFRLEGVPDTERFISLATAVQDELEWTLDKIVTEQTYYPPEVYDVVPDADGNIANAMKTANARYHYEKRREAPAVVLRHLRTFMGALADLMSNPSALPPPAMPVAPPAMMGAAPGMPAPPPMQVAPGMAPPAALPPGGPPMGGPPPGMAV
jgi:hypothetical protein